MSKPVFVILEAASQAINPAVRLVLPDIELGTVMEVGFLFKYFI